MTQFTPKPVKPTVPFATFDALDIRLGTIEEVAKVPDSRKLVALTVSFGDHNRTILAGLQGERADLVALVGVQTLFVINLEPRRMAGAISEGMLFDIGYADGLQPAMTLAEHPLPAGTRAG